jgi:RNA ligase
MPSIHPARAVPFDALMAGLMAAKAEGLIYRKFDVPTGRSLFVYSPRAVYERMWTPFVLMARGLILHEASRRVIATPLPKFFNVGEGEGDLRLPPGPFEVFEKLDGSLAIIHHFDGIWRAATKGAFDSDQARWTEARLAAQDVSVLIPGITYLAEYTGPDNVVVVRYPETALVLLTAYLADGTEMDTPGIEATAAALGWRTPKRHAFGSFADLALHAAALPRDQEGYVIRWQDGTRLKLKGAEYRRIHALISRCTPLAIWEAMSAGDDLGAMRRDLPEEFLADFDNITGIIANQVATLEARVAEAAAAIASMSDKDVGLALKSLGDDQTRPFLFGFRKTGGITGKAREAMWRQVRPTGNALDGYQPSSGLERVMVEAV